MISLVWDGTTLCGGALAGLDGVDRGQSVYTLD